MKNFIVACAALFAIHSTAKADRFQSYGLGIMPMVGYGWNNQIDSGVNAGIAIGQQVHECVKMINFAGTGYQTCQSIATAGLLVEGLYSNRGNGHSVGLYFGGVTGGLTLKFSRFEASKSQKFWPSSDRFSAGMRILLLNFDIGIKREDGEDFYRPSLGFGVGL